ncbi:hypothetical protein NXS98_07560 [Fontisphaera persica]|uniref:hypothetical protein n=1 Tax=Fontisphaera persica TaxID=2974023 RepID=UPI0024BF57EC|nr:hypothetical protein [Fontisphaera persica]WCJ60967.1 hypothetical protein NXS98_07560 [Fontisphaera persica]
MIDEISTVEEIEAEVALLIQDARNRGMNVAADMLQNYVNGGGDQVLSVGWLRSFDRVRNAEKKNQKHFEQSFKKIAAEMKCDESRTFSDYWDALISYSGRGFSTEELFWASGDSTLTSSGSFSLKKNCCVQKYRGKGINMNCSEVIITGNVNHHWHDVYDWHAGLGVSIPGHGRIPDTAMDKLRTQGRAKNFNMTSDWRQNLVGKIFNCPSYGAYFQWTGL